MISKPVIIIWASSLLLVAKILVENPTSLPFILLQRRFGTTFTLLFLSQLDISLKIFSLWHWKREDIYYLIQVKCIPFTDIGEVTIALADFRKLI